MPIMSYTPAQRRLWHAGKKKNIFGAGWISILQGKNFIGAWAPPRAKRGMFYKPRKRR